MKWSILYVFDYPAFFNPDKPCNINTNYLSAINYLKLFQQIKDSLFNVIVHKQLNELQIQADQVRNAIVFKLQYPDLQLRIEQALLLSDFFLKGN